MEIEIEMESAWRVISSHNHEWIIINNHVGVGVDLIFCVYDVMP